MTACLKCPAGTTCGADGSVTLCSVSYRNQSYWYQNTPKSSNIILHHSYIEILTSHQLISYTILILKYKQIIKITYTIPILKYIHFIMQYLTPFRYWNTYKSLNDILVTIQILKYIQIIKWYLTPFRYWNIFISANNIEILFKQISKQYCTSFRYWNTYKSLNNILQHSDIKIHRNHQTISYTIQILKYIQIIK